MVVLQLRDQPALIQAIFAGDLGATEAIINGNKGVNDTDVEKRTPLHAAAFKADAGIVAALLEAGARVNARDCKWVTPLHRACSINADKVAALLLKSHAESKARDKLWQTPLHVAAANNAYECVELIADHIPNIDVTDRSGKTALHHAAHNGHARIVDLLISKGSSVNAADKKYLRPLHFAAQMGHDKIIDILIDCGADINASDCNQCTALHIASSNGNDTVCKLLLLAGADKDAQNTYGNTPLHLACLNGQQLVCRNLINAGADPEAVNFQGQTPLHISAASAHGAECMAYLLSQEVNVNRRSLDGRTPLHMTAIHGKFTRSTSLIDHGALIDCTDKNGCTPLHITAQYGHDLLATTLMSYGADPSFRGYEGRTPLHMSCLSGNVECCRKFLMAGVDLNAVDDTGKIPIHYAAYRGSFECIDLLVSNGAKFCEKDNISRVPLHYAAAQGHYQCVFTLAGIGTPLNIEDDQGCTPLHLAAAYDLESKCVEYFLEHKADPLSVDKKGFTPLHYACAGNNTNAGLKLLSSFNYKLAIEKMSANLVTPLHLAAKVGNYKIVDELIVNGADADVQDEQGITPLMLACREGQLKCAITLVAAGASITICDKINNMTAVHYCARNGYHECLEQIFSSGRGKESIEMMDSLQRTPLMLAVSCNHIECVKVLLDNSMDLEKVVNMVDSDSHSSLFRAVALGHSDIVKLLLQKDAKANIVDVNGKSVIHLAAACGYLSCLQILVDFLKEPEVFAMDRQECTALHWACYRGNISCVEFLLKKFRFKEMPGNKFSPVHCACYSGSVQCLQMLLNHYGDQIVSLQDNRRRYPLHICALHGHTEAANLLLEHGATLDVLDEDGRTPFTAAAQFGQNEIIELFMKFKVEELHQDKFGNTALHWACLMKHTSTALLLLKNMKGSNIHSVNNEKQTALHLAARNGLVYVTRELLRKGASVYAVDSEGYTPALYCAPNNQVAQCLALILLNSSNGPSGESDTTHILKCFVKNTEQKNTSDKMNPLPNKPVSTQTDEASTQKSNSVNPHRSLVSTTWAEKATSSDTSTDLNENGKKNEEIDQRKIKSDPGSNTSFYDMFVSGKNIDEAHDEEEREAVMGYFNMRVLSEIPRECQYCLLMKRRCLDCCLRFNLKKFLMGKHPAKGFNKFLYTLLTKSSPDFRAELFHALEQRADFFWKHCSHFASDLDRILSRGEENKRDSFEELCSDMRRIFDSRVKNKTEETDPEKQSATKKVCSTKNNDDNSKDTVSADKGNTVNEATESTNIKDNSEHKESISEPLDEKNNILEPVFQPEFLKTLQALSNRCDALHVARKYVQKLLDQDRVIKIHTCERHFEDDDLLNHVERLMGTLMSSCKNEDMKDQKISEVKSVENEVNTKYNETVEDENEPEMCQSIIDKSEVEITKEEDSFQQHVDNKNKSIVDNQSDVSTEKPDSLNDTIYGETFNENSESSDNDFY